MNTTWRVTKITSTEGQTIAELRQVEWFKKNPLYTQMSERFDGVFAADGQDAAEALYAVDEWPDEFLTCEPGDEDGEFIDAFGTLSLDITDGLDLHAGDDVAMNLDAQVRVRES